MLCPHPGPRVTSATSEAVWKKLMIKSPSAAWSPGKTNSWVRAIGHSALKNTIQSQSWKTNTNFTPTNPVLSPVSLLFRLFRDRWILTGLITKNNFGKLIACHLNASLRTYKKYIGLKKTLTNTISSLPLQTLAIRKRDDISSGVNATLCTAAPHALHALAGAVGTVGVQRTRFLAGWAGTLTGVSCTGGNAKVSSSNKIPESPGISPAILEYLTSGFFTDEAMGGGSTGVGSEPSHLRLFQVGAETRVTGLAGQPTEAAVGERRHVFPTPVRHIDFPEAHPWRQPLGKQSRGLGNSILNRPLCSYRCYDLLC